MSNFGKFSVLTLFTMLAFGAAAPVAFASAITVTATTTTKVYDGTTNASMTPTITAGALDLGDTATLSESYDNPNVGAGKTLTPLVIIKNASNTDVTANYTITLINDTTGVITKATPTVGLAVLNSPVTFDGTAHAATVSTTTASVPGVIANVAIGGAGTQTSAGAYAVTVDFVPTDTINYESLTGLSAGNFVISKATSATVVACNPSSVIYSGSAKTPCSVSVTGAGSLNITSFTPTYVNNTNVGTSTASYTYADDGNHTGSSGSKDFTINVDPNATSVALTTTTTGGTTSGTINNSATMSTTTSIGNVTVTMPANITISAPAGWNGTINLPSPIATDVAPVSDPANSGNTATAGGSIEVGFGTTTLTFDKGVRLLLTGQAGKQVGYSHGAGTFTKITNICSADTQTVGNALAAGSDCAISVGSDLVIWTKHFSTFTTYTTAMNAPEISPNSSVFHGSVGVTMNVITGTEIRYTTDGTTPSCSSTLYTGGTLTFNSSTVVKAVRCDPTAVSLTSAVSSANFSPASGTNLTSGGGGGGGSISAPATVTAPTIAPVATVVTPTPVIAPAVPQVLGTAVYNFVSDLQLNSSGNDVIELQKFLIASGFDIPGITKIGLGYGTFGKQTRAAVIAYQKANGISPARGYVGALTRAMLSKGAVAAAKPDMPVKSQSSLSSTQANAIISLIESFGADAEVIAKVKASLGL